MSGIISGLLVCSGKLWLLVVVVIVKFVVEVGEVSVGKVRVESSDRVKVFSFIVYFFYY